MLEGTLVNGGRVPLSVFAHEIEGYGDGDIPPEKVLATLCGKPWKPYLLDGVRAKTFWLLLPYCMYCTCAECLSALEYTLRSRPQRDATEYFSEYST